MVLINIAYTEPINPAGAEPVLTRDQIWKGLQRKIRHAQDFVPVITSTDVIEDKGDEVTRIAYMKSPDSDSTQQVREVCKSYYPVKVDFWQSNGALITNTVSDGPSFKENDYNMTYTFEWRYPEMTEGSEEYQKKSKEHLKLAQMAVHESIEAMRKMAKAGELD